MNYSSSVVAKLLWSASVLHCCSAETFIPLTSCLRLQYRTSAGSGEGWNLEVCLVDFFNQRLHSLPVTILKRKVVFWSFRRVCFRNFT